MGMEDSGSSDCHVTTDEILDADAAATSSSFTVNHTLRLLQSDDPNSRLQAAKEIRRLTKTSRSYRRHFSAAVGPLVEMLAADDANEAALAALLNLAVKDESNKTSIINAGALKPIIGFLHSDNPSLQEHAAAALITLSASSPANKAIITSSGAIPPLVKLLQYGSTSQAKSDAVKALHNLSTHPNALTQILQTQPIPPLVTLLKSCKRSSQAAEKCTALIESLVAFEEGRAALTSEEGGILAVVEVLERGPHQSREHAMGALLIMCRSNRDKYREPILREGVIPGLLELTVQGSARSRSDAQEMLRLLREDPHPRAEIRRDAIENIVCDIVARIDGEEQLGKARQMLAEMVQVSMERSLRHLQKRATTLVCAPTTDLAVSNGCASEVPSK